MAIRCVDTAITTAQWLDFEDITPASSPTNEQKHHQNLYNLLLFIDRTTRKRAQHCRLYPSLEVDDLARDATNGTSFRMRATAADFDLPQVRPLLVTSKLWDADTAKLGAQFAAIRARFPDLRMDDQASGEADNQLLALLARLPGMTAMARDLSDASSTCECRDQGLYTGRLKLIGMAITLFCSTSSIR